MSTGDEASLARQRQSLRGQLRAQRQKVAQQLAPAAGVQGRFPRSVTMRLLIDRPALMSRLAVRLVGARVAGTVSTLLVLVRVLRSVVAVNAAAAPAAPAAGAGVNSSPV